MRIEGCILDALDQGWKITLQIINDVAEQWSLLVMLLFRSNLYGRLLGDNIIIIIIIADAGVYNNSVERRQKEETEDRYK